MFDTFLIKYAEIGVKGGNKKYFEARLASQIARALRPVGDFKCYYAEGRVYADALGPYDFDEAIAALSRVFGVCAVCPAVRTDDEGFERLLAEAVDCAGYALPDKSVSFKVKARRSRKNYPLDSMEIASRVGEALLTAYPALHVDVHHPDVLFNVEIREHIYMYATQYPGPGGMPVGSGGRAMSLLSGGIDSPVATYMLAKRGMETEAVYYDAPPYTSERARQKVVDLATTLSRYAGPIRLHVVNFTPIQLAIYERCPHEEMTIIMRRYMMRIAERLAVANHCDALVTGESLGQVASQTMQSLAATDAVCSLPVFRPLIGFDKADIVEYAERIGTYETSIQPYEDCCTIFVASHPVTKPSLKYIERHEKRLADIADALLNEAADTETIINIE